MKMYSVIDYRDNTGNLPPDNIDVLSDADNTIAEIYTDYWIYGIVQNGSTEEITFGCEGS